MAASLKMSLPSADDLFSTQASRDDTQREKVQEIPLALIDPFPEHPFHVREDEAMTVMAESVKAVGVLTPAVARKVGKQDGGPGGEIYRCRGFVFQSTNSSESARCAA